MKDRNRAYRRAVKARRSSRVRSRLIQVYGFSSSDLNNGYFFRQVSCRTPKSDDKSQWGCGSDLSLRRERIRWEEMEEEMR